MSAGLGDMETGVFWAGAESQVPRRMHAKTTVRRRPPWGKFLVDREAGKRRGIISRLEGLPCAPRFLFDGKAFDQVAADRITNAGPLRNNDCAARSDLDGGIDDVFVPVAAAGGDVAGKGEAGESGKGNIVGAADSGFEHSAAPDGDFFGGAIFLDGAPAGMSADAAEFDVDDAARAQFDRGGSITYVPDRFIQADGRAEALLKFCMRKNVVPPKRLFDHEQI